MNSLSAEKKEFIENALKTHGYNNINIQSDGETEKGDGYVGVVEFIKATQEDGTNKQLDLVLKSAKPNENLRMQSPIRIIFLREIYMYETIIPEFLSFQKKKNILKPFTGVPKVYGCSKVEYHESLLLENMKASGYTMLNRKEPMDAEHVALVFNEYAKFHAISLAMRQLEPQNYKRLTAKLTNVFEDKSNQKTEHIVAMTNILLQRAVDAVEGCDDEVKNGIKKFSKDVYELFKDIENPDDQLVVLHADCWCNNIMFKYEDSTAPTKPTKVCLLDWQVSKNGSPVLDLAYFLFVSASLDVMNESKKYLQLYHDTVKRNLRNFGCNPNKVFPYELLETHWKRYAKYGLVTAIMITTVLLRDSQDVPDLAELADKGENLVEKLTSNNNNMSVEEAFKKRIAGIATCMTKNGLF